MGNHKGVGWVTIRGRVGIYCGEDCEGMMTQISRNGPEISCLINK